MEPARTVGKVFFPLDEELGLAGSDLTPHAQEGLARLATWVSFGRAAELLEGLTGVQVSASGARRLTLQVGQAALQEWEEQTTQLEHSREPVPAQAPALVMSADGAMVPLRGGVWAEVKTLAIGEVETTKHGESQVGKLSYCSRLTDVAGFEEATLLETHRREVEEARAIAAVMDGADWLQGFVDYHRADAVRILDFPHAAEYVHAIGEAVRQAGHRLPESWLEGVLHRLKHEGPERVLLHLARLSQRCSHREVEQKIQYLLTRHSHMQYPAFQAAGWPIGSGMVESANKLVVEARLKGAGMHWKRENVNPMLVLRNAVINDRWTQTWQGRMKQVRQVRQQQREQRAQARVDQATQHLIGLLLPFVLSRRSQHAPVAAPVGSVSSPALTPPASAPKGRTEAQHRWGRRPVSLRGSQIQAGFAKK